MASRREGASPLMGPVTFQVVYQNASERLAAPQPTSVAAGAWIKEGYKFYDWARLPARLFYDGKELAVITD